MNSKKGISLVGLVVTIIVLLILAGVSITFILGPNSLSKKTTDGKIDTRNGMAMDRVKSRETTLSILEFSDDTDGETAKEFTDKLFSEGILDPYDDFYDKDNYKLYIGLSDDGSFIVGSKRYKYVVEIKEVGDTTVATGPITFTFNLNGGKHSGSTSDVKKIGNKNQNVSAPTNITRENYTFAGWSPNVPNKFDKDTTFVAIWNTGDITISFNLNQGNINGNTTNVVKDGSFGDPISKPQNPTRANHKFKGWEPSIPSIFTKNRTFTAQWEKEKYTIVYNLNGGKYKNSAVNPRKQIEYNEEIPALTPEFTGKTFIGWAPNLGNATKNQTYTALWSVPMEVEMKKATTSQSILIPIVIGDNNTSLVSWNDGDFVKLTGSYPTITNNVASGVPFKVKIAGRFKSFSYQGRSESHTNQLYKLINWGVIGAEKYNFSRVFVLSESYPEDNNGTVYGCENLIGPIPVPYNESFINITSFAYTFGGCKNLDGEIPAKLFRNAYNATSFEGVFHTCNNLSGEIPVSLFFDSPDVLTFDHAFYRCGKLTGTIPEGLFYNNKKVISFHSVFNRCTNITHIPENLFSENINAEIFTWAFLECNNLIGPIPEKLFYNNTQATSFRAAFYRCYELKGPIPPTLFSKNVKAENFFSVFYECYSLNGTIPQNLFSQNTKATTFQTSFYHCKSLTGALPELLFANNPDVTSFENAFNSCTGLTSISPNMFNNNQKVTSFLSAFSNCTNLTGNAPSLWTRTNVTSFSNCFYRMH